MSAEELCGALHPERSAVTCDRRAHQGVGFHRDRDGLVWEADPLPEVRRTGRLGLAPIAVRTARPRRTGRAADAVADWRESR